MKILVYYVGVHHLFTAEKVNKKVEEAQTRLKQQFPHLASQILVIPRTDRDHDELEVLDMSPTSYPYPTVVTNPVPTPINPFPYNPNPFYTTTYTDNITTSFGCHGHGTGVEVGNIPVANGSIGTPWPGA